MDSALDHRLNAEVHIVEDRRQDQDHRGFRPSRQVIGQIWRIGQDSLTKFFAVALSTATEAAQQVTQDFARARRRAASKIEDQETTAPFR